MSQQWKEGKKGEKMDLLVTFFLFLLHFKHSNCSKTLEPNVDLPVDQQHGNSPFITELLIESQNQANENSQGLGR